MLDVEQSLFRPIEEKEAPKSKFSQLLEAMNNTRLGLTLYDEKLDWYWRPQLTFRNPEDFRGKFKRDCWIEGDLEP